MLRSFRVANHRSIRDEQELLLLPAYDKHRPVMPVAAIFGANASGKSNLLDALAFMQDAVRSSYRLWEPGAGVPRHPFRLDPRRAKEPSLYAVDIQLDGIRYTYGFTLDDEKVHEEWLYAYPQGRRRIIFEREAGMIRLGSTIPEHRSRQATLTDLTRANALFLSTAAHTNQTEVMPVYDWFRDGIVMTERPSHSLILKRFARRLESDAADRIATVELIRAADLGITDVQVERPGAASLEDKTFEELRDKVGEFFVRTGYLVQRGQQEQTEADSKKLMEIGAELRAELGGSLLLFLHGEQGIALSIDEQSEGTRAWLALLDHGLTALEQGRVLVVDEIDNSVHPRLTARLIELFQDNRTNRHGAQLVLTTHDASLLGTSFGREIFQRDQIWFVEKDDAGATALFPLTDFHPRKGENTERRYLGGSYGAVPAVFSDTLVEAYLAARPELLDDSA